MLLDPGMDLTLRPMRYPHFYDRFRDAIRNTWTVEEVDLHSDLADLARLSPAEQHLVNRLVAFFATGDTIVANNLVLNLYQHVNSPEGRLYLSRQLFEEAVHVQFYLTLLDTYVPDETERAEAFAAVENIPSIKRKAEFCFQLDRLGLRAARAGELADRRAFLLNLICFAACIEGLFFFGAFAYVYFLRSRGLLNGLASGTNWVFRDESMHMAFAFDVVDTVRAEEPELFDDELTAQVSEMIAEAVECEAPFAEDLLGQGVSGMSLADMREYLQHVADRRLAQLGIEPLYGSANPFAVHGTAGRPGTVQLLRAQGLRLPGRRHRRRRLRRRLLNRPRTPPSTPQRIRRARRRLARAAAERPARRGRGVRTWMRPSTASVCSSMTGVPGGTSGTGRGSGGAPGSEADRLRVMTVIPAGTSRLIWPPMALAYITVRWPCSSASRRSSTTCPPMAVTTSRSGTTHRPSRRSVVKNAVTARELSSRSGCAPGSARSSVSPARSPRVRAV